MDFNAKPHALAKTAQHNEAFILSGKENGGICSEVFRKITVLLKIPRKF